MIGRFACRGSLLKCASYDLPNCAAANCAWAPLVRYRDRGYAIEL
jgi:hypothetical protein